MDVASTSGALRNHQGPIAAHSPSSSPDAHHSHAPYASKLSNGYAQALFSSTQAYNTSPVAERKSQDHNPPNYLLNQDIGTTGDVGDGSSVTSQASTIVLRRLPSTMSNEALASMLLFAEDFLDVKFIPADSLEDAGFQTALARFRTVEGAQEARNRLNGRLNATNDANMIVEVRKIGSNSRIGTQRKSSDGQSGRQMSTSASSGSSNGMGVRQPSRYSGTFQSMDKISPTKIHNSSVIGDGRGVESAFPSHGFFSPQPSIGASTGADRTRVSGKSVINDEVDEETGELLRDPVAFAKNGHIASPKRQSMNQQLPVSRLANLHLSTEDPIKSDGLSPSSGFTSARTLQSLQSPVSEFSSNGLGSAISPTGLFQMGPPFQRTNYPPANPADQNPPCNTLYVGNLPVDASEDELKALFSKQRGYKRLCFRTKHNGPMCFVEFEDITFATKALNELYGTMLHNSIKGGIRLSFSKNPLGVRAGQSSGIGPTSPLGSPGTGFGSSVGAPPGFTTVNGPPPGLSMPPGLTSPISSGPLSPGAGPNASKFFPQSRETLINNSSHYPIRAQSNASTYPLNSPPNNFPDFMMGR